jgi:hypothetical protein
MYLKQHKLFRRRHRNSDPLGRKDVIEDLMKELFDELSLIIDPKQMKSLPEGRMLTNSGNYAKGNNRI